MFNIVLGKDGQVGGSAAQIQQGHTELFFFIGQDGLARGQRFQNDIANIQPGAVGAFNDIMGGCHCSGDNMYFGLQTHAGHSHRVLDAALIIHHIFLRQDMNHLTVHGDGDGPGRIDHAVDIRLADFVTLDRNDSAAVKAGDVAAGDTGIYG